MAKDCTFHCYHTDCIYGAVEGWDYSVYDLATSKTHKLSSSGPSSDIWIFRGEVFTVHQLLVFIFHDYGIFILGSYQTLPLYSTLRMREFQANMLNSIRSPKAPTQQ